jgi:LysR family transcriptional regulator, glycine cleavage system transcriptional activator
MRHLPSLNALRAFEAAGRHLNLGRAAGELNVTHGAVSKQVKLLEEQLAVQLATRTKDGVKLTAHGQTLLPKITRVLDDIALAARDLNADSDGGTVHISCMPAFASHWLIPRLGAFRARHPGIDLIITTLTDSGAKIDPEIDIAICFGTPKWPDMIVKQLTTLAFFPVCSPTLLSQPNKLRKPSDLKNHTLIGSPQGSHWQDWNAFAGLESPMEKQSLRFSDFNHVIAAARAGLGVAMGDNVTVAMDLQQGTLVRPLSQILHSPTVSYYAVLPPERPISRSTQNVIDWIFSEISQLEE